MPYMNAIFWRKLVSSKNPRFGHKCLKAVLGFFAVFYAIAVWLRNKAYDFRIKKAKKLDATVVSVGNITTGGTGKTPIVAFLANDFEMQNIKTAILTRGYKASKDSFSDEAAMLAKAAPETTVIVNPNRYLAGQKAIGLHGAQLLIMDDGFQHRKLYRDIDIVAVDATEPFGQEKMLPAGLLREPVKSVKRADAVIITRANQSCKENIEKITARLLKINPKLVIASAVHNPVCVKLLKGRQMSLDEIGFRKLYAFCGIGNPQAFFQTLEDSALNIADKKVYNDHHKYTQEDIDEICRQARYKQAEMIITTQKDWVKTALLCMEKHEIPIGYLAVELQFNSGQAEVINLINERMKKNV